VDEKEYKQPPEQNKGKQNSKDKSKKELINNKK
jgi:hypothetical protein